jgi:hypothetical protein
MYLNDDGLTSEQRANPDRAKKARLTVKSDVERSSGLFNED